MKTRIIKAGLGSYEVQAKQAWYLPWRTVYNGIFPYRGSFAEAQKAASKLEKL